MEKASVKGPSKKAAWYKQFKWLVLCTSRMKAFCFCCRFSTSRKLVTSSSKAEEAFTVTGFSNWKKAVQKFNEHEICHAHKEVVLNIPSVNETAQR